MLETSDFVALERCLGACILGLLVSEGSELGDCEVGMPHAKDVNRFCVMKSGGDFLIGCLIGFDRDSHFSLWYSEVISLKTESVCSSRTFGNVYI